MTNTRLTTALAALTATLSIGAASASAATYAQPAQIPPSGGTTVDPSAPPPAARWVSHGSTGPASNGWCEMQAGLASSAEQSAANAPTRGERDAANNYAQTVVRNAQMGGCVMVHV